MRVPTMALPGKLDVGRQLDTVLTGSSEALCREITAMTAERAITGRNAEGGCCYGRRDTVEND